VTLEQLSAGFDRLADLTARPERQRLSPAQLDRLAAQIRPLVAELAADLVLVEQGIAAEAEALGLDLGDGLAILEELRIVLERAERWWGSASPMAIVGSCR
jgi:hypothetical protein